MLLFICRPDLRKYATTGGQLLTLQPPLDVSLCAGCSYLTTNAHRSRRPLTYRFARRLTGPTLQEEESHQMRIIIIAQL